MAAYAAQETHPYIVGFSMAGDEANFPIGDFAGAYAIAAEAGLGCTVHAGEWAGPESVRAALALPVTRVDHGVRAIEEPSLVTELAERGMVLNTCPTSNVVLGVFPGFDEHPLPRLRDAGIRLTLGSDDPPYFGATIGGEYRVCVERLGFSRDELEAITLTGIDAAFCEAELKTARARGCPPRSRREDPRHRERRASRRGARAVLRDDGHDVVGLDVLASPFTRVVGSVADRAWCAHAWRRRRGAARGDAAQAPRRLARRARRFVDTNITGTLNLLEEAVAAGVEALRLHQHHERVRPGADARRRARRRRGSPRTSRPCRATSTAPPRPPPRTSASSCTAITACRCLILRTSRFFPEDDDRDDVRAAYADANLKVNELLYRRVDLEDVVDAHLLRAGARAGDRLRPLHHQRDDAVHARRPRRAARRRARGRAAAVSATTRRSTPRAAGRCSPAIDRVYVNARARDELGWAPRYDFGRALDRLAAGEDRAARSPARSAPRATTRSRPGVYTTRARGRR